MKIRKGFVSNSSSTSFCIVGAKFPNNGEDEDYNSCSKAIRAIYQKYKKNKNDLDFLDYIHDNISDDLCKLRLETGIGNYECNTSFIGFPIGLIEDNETFMEFKDRICNHLNVCFQLNDKEKFTTKDINIYVDGGYDG